MRLPARQVFVMAEVATLLFEESPVMFAKFLRANQYPRKHTVEQSVVDKCASLGISGETSSGGSVGVTLLPATTVEACLLDRRRNDLVKPFKLSLLKLASQEAKRYIANGDFESALPIALDVVKRGQDIYPPDPKTPPAVELFPMYLLAAEANMGVNRDNAAEDFLRTRVLARAQRPRGRRRRPSVPMPRAHRPTPAIARPAGRGNRRLRGGYVPPQLRVGTGRRPHELRVLEHGDVLRDDGRVVQERSRVQDGG